MTASRSGVAPLGHVQQSLVDRVTQVIGRSIIDGTLQPGESVAISDLSSDLGVSHSPVREALQRLSEKGLVELRLARRAVVTPLTIDDLEELFRLRRVNEVDAATRACLQLTDADLTDLARDFKTLSKAPLDTDEFWRSHDAFHVALLRPVLSDRLHRLLHEIWESVERYIRALHREAGTLANHPAGDMHRPLLDAARSGDDEVMRAAILEHLVIGERDLSAVAAKSLKTSA